MEINGFQNPDGSVRQRWISVAGLELDAAAAREVAYDLLAAADELEQMNGQDPAVTR
ncbi:hypothetical protein MSM1_15690 [Mycobacterium sp. SM1]|uniref:hypothetical protein n=1 Tax=Mycobacterium sp. SM1 TaxID=2816243 RepID=UPI001BCB601A|nr:hypothetical protein [Mycobacterium sp. SM1]MBS4729723.1 hypothetical protein [Mycobacterium sp. SM1]